MAADGSAATDGSFVADGSIAADGFVAAGVTTYEVEQAEVRRPAGPTA